MAISDVDPWHMSLRRPFGETVPTGGRHEAPTVAPEEDPTPDADPAPPAPAEAVPDTKTKKTADA